MGEEGCWSVVVVVVGFFFFLMWFVVVVWLVGATVEVLLPLVFLWLLFCIT